MPVADESVIDVLGVTARGWPDLSENARELVGAAEVLIGSDRQLGTVRVRDEQQVIGWPSPLRERLPSLLADLSGRRLVALASGDPTLSGIATTLIDLLGPERVRVHPAISSVALARARLGWSAEGSEVITVVGRELDRVRARLGPDVRLIVLSSDETTPAALAELLVEEGYGASELSVLGDLGAAYESRTDGIAANWTSEVSRLNLVGVRCRLDQGRRARSWAAGLPDEAYEHDGQLTKRDLRASALARLEPLPGQLLWDLGAGAGSVAIEWSRTDPRCRAIAVEQDPARAARIGRNASRLGVPGIQVVATTSADALDYLPRPDAVFIGGGADDDLVRRCWHLLAPNGRIVVHAVTLETEAVVTTAWRAFGGELTRVAIESAEPLGSFTGWRPARAVVQWSAARPA